MNAPLDEQLGALWTDVQSDLTFPAVRPLLAHYTSVATLEKISLSGEIWFSNPLFMNDWEELLFGMNTGAKELRTHSAIVEACESLEAHAVLIEEFDQLFSSFDKHHVMDTYVLCLSQHDPDNEDGILSMWRGYGANGAGVALVFDASKINTVEHSPFVVSRVRYASTPERLDWIDEKVTSLAEIIRSNAKTRENLHAIAYAFIERLKLFSLFTKHDGFSEEKEWRIVYFSDRDPNRHLAPMLGYAITPRGVEPKLKVKLAELPAPFSERLDLDHIAERILLGPSISTLVAEKSLQRMLDLTSRGGLAGKVKSSSIPYRP